MEGGMEAKVLFLGGNEVFIGLGIERTGREKCMKKTTPISTWVGSLVSRNQIRRFYGFDAMPKR